MRLIAASSAFRTPRSHGQVLLPAIGVCIDAHSTPAGRRSRSPCRYLTTLRLGFRKGMPFLLILHCVSVSVGRPFICPTSSAVSNRGEVKEPGLPWDSRFRLLGQKKLPC